MNITNRIVEAYLNEVQGVPTSERRNRHAP